MNKDGHYFDEWVPAELWESDTADIKVYVSGPDKYFTHLVQAVQFLADRPDMDDNDPVVIQFGLLREFVEQAR